MAGSAQESAEEVEALGACYPEEGCLSISELGAAVGGTLRLPPPLTLGGGPVTLAFSLPPGYPLAAPRLSVQTSASRQVGRLR